MVRARLGFGRPAYGRPFVRQTDGSTLMSDVKVERKEPVSRDEAADWLSLLSRAFTQGGDAELPFGPTTLSLRIPDSVRAEFEVEVDGDEIEIEIEFKWSTAQSGADSSADAGASRQAPAKKGSSAGKSGRGSRAHGH
jgi:amphi-Trp domain-containing protein